MFFLFIYFIFLPPAASVPPLDHDKVTDLDLVKNANRIFPFLFASQYFYFFLPPAASVSPLDHDKVTDLDREKNANRIFPFFDKPSSKGKKNRFFQRFDLLSTLPWLY